MVQKKEPRQEQIIYSPYYYPNFSRYNFPSKIGGDEEQYTEQTFSFPRWDDEETVITPRLRRRASSSPLLFNPEGLLNVEDIEDYFNNKLLNNDSLEPNNNHILLSDDDESEDDESEAVCEKIQSDIDLARKDQKSDYDQFRKAYATFHDDIRALQREIEAIEAIFMKNSADSKRGNAITNDDGTEIYYEPPPITNNKNNNNNNGGGSHLLSSMPSAAAAAAAARGMIAKKRSSPSIMYRNRVPNQQQQQEQQQNISGNFNDNNNNNNNNRRCLGIEDGWLQERVHQNEGIRC